MPSVRTNPTVEINLNLLRKEITPKNILSADGLTHSCFGYTSSSSVKALNEKHNKFIFVNLATDEELETFLKPIQKIFNFTAKQNELHGTTLEYYKSNVEVEFKNLFNSYSPRYADKAVLMKYIYNNMSNGNYSLYKQLDVTFHDIKDYSDLLIRGSFLRLLTYDYHVLSKIKYNLYTFFKTLAKLQQQAHYIYGLEANYFTLKYSVNSYGSFVQTKRDSILELDNILKAYEQNYKNPQHKYKPGQLWLNLARDAEEVTT